MIALGALSGVSAPPGGGPAGPGRTGRIHSGADGLPATDVAQRADALLSGSGPTGAGPLRTVVISLEVFMAVGRPDPGVQRAAAGPTVPWPISVSRPSLTWEYPE